MCGCGLGMCGMDGWMDGEVGEVILVFVPIYVSIYAKSLLDSWLVIPSREMQSCAYLSSQVNLAVYLPFL